ncbi:thioesterase superfamily protein (plasmid) [Methylobacterium nodulans ORS 2060]|uniref:Acyl-coenzyme A thioesterase THEM4 n=1 Tax=Methylobacterium nodulans (strain LMG 21967 / CNCM I-2342 / ORS 2060) TaxID=460265 RepID=B8IWF5_METNO|nr:hotdog fold domain-containing protein [Methylobacterium nodulans]ACL62745.1 thioesterase superfamily protein [Methylobacterium nodulans ORS 2060]
MKAIQDHYPPNFAHCYGCGPANPFGHHLKSYLLDNHTEARFTPDQRYSGGVPDNVYGGMIASLLDCHGTASAAAFAYRARGRAMGDEGPPIRFVTASLHVNFRKPTPLGEELLITCKLKSLEGKKALVLLSLSARGEECARGEMLAVELKS